MASKIGMAMSGANGNGTQGNGDAGHSEGEDKEKGDEPHSNGGGIVKQIMSNLPTSGTLHHSAPARSRSSLPRFGFS